MKPYNLTVNVGDVIWIGRFKNVRAKITAIEFDKKGQPVIHTSKGKRKLLNYNLDAVVDTGFRFKGKKKILMERTK